MPNVLPTIPNDPPQGIQALLDKVYLWNPDVSNDLIEKINALLANLGDAIGAIRPYNELVAPINQYEPCYYGDGVYVAKTDLSEIPVEFNEEDWILIARKEITADEIHINFAGQEDTVQGAIDTLKTDQDELGDQVSAIESKIPEDASETNPLVTKVTLSDYLPLSGGTLTGSLGFSSSSKMYEIEPTPWGNLNFIINGVQTVDIEQNVGLLPATLNKFSLGRVGRGWKNVYTAKLNNGEDIAIPTTGGTLARIEDIDAIGGDGTAGQVLTKTDDGMAWQDSTGGGASLPDQTGNAGKFLMTDGTTTSWGNALANNSTSTGALAIGKNSKGATYGVAVGAYASVTAQGGTAVGSTSQAKGQRATAVGGSPIASGESSIAIGDVARASAENSIQISVGASSHDNTDANTFKVGNANGNFEMMSADGTVPTDRYTTTPVDAGTYVPKLTIAEDGTTTREWGAESGGGASLPDQPGNENTFLMTDGTTPSWSANRLVVKTGSVAIGTGASAFDIETNSAAVAVGRYAHAKGLGSISIGSGSGGSSNVHSNTISIGRNAYANAENAIQLGGGSNTDANTFKVANANGNFEMMDADGNVPLDRLTYVTEQIGDISTALTAILGE